MLIVEDNADMSAYIESCLKEHFRIAVAPDGGAGLALAQKLKPDVVISDLMMPVMDGIEFTRRMKENPRTNFIPIIVHSVKEDQQSIREALTAGAQEYIIKPFEAENLIFRIRNLLSSREHFARKLRTETITEPTVVELPSDDEQLLRRLSAVVEANIQNPLFDIEYLAGELHMSRMAALPPYAAHCGPAHRLGDHPRHPHQACGPAACFGRHACQRSDGRGGDE